MGGCQHQQPPSLPVLQQRHHIPLVAVGAVWLPVGVACKGAGCGRGMRGSTSGCDPCAAGVHDTMDTHKAQCNQLDAALCAFISAPAACLAGRNRPVAHHATGPTVRGDIRPEPYLGGHVGQQSGQTGRRLRCHPLAHQALGRGTPAWGKSSQYSPVAATLLPHHLRGSTSKPSHRTAPIALCMDQSHTAGWPVSIGKLWQDTDITPAHPWHPGNYTSNVLRAEGDAATHHSGSALGYI